MRAMLEVDPGAVKDQVGCCVETRLVVDRHQRLSSKSRAPAMTTDARIAEGANEPRASRSLGISLDSLLQFLRWPEGDLLAGRDLDRCAGRRVATHPSRSRPYLQDAQTGQADFVALLEMLGGQRHQIAQHRFGNLLRQVMAFRQLGCDLLERDGDLRRNRRRSRLLGRCGGLLRRCGFLCRYLGSRSGSLLGAAAFFAGGMTISLDKFGWATCSRQTDSDNNERL